MWFAIPAALAGNPCEGLPLADGFDFPVGPPDARGYYDAQPFGRNTHLGSDWNGNGLGNTDFGDPVFAVADGVVTEAADWGGGWGNVLRIAHRVDGACVESLSAHLATMESAPGARLKRGQRIGTIGDAGGIYPAHLHFEIRAEAGLPLGGGYGPPAGQVDPTSYIRGRRPA